MQKEIKRNTINYQYDDMNGMIEVLSNGEMLGTIFANKGDWELIENGANPIEEEWEDGIGNVLSYDGWGATKSEAE